MTVALGIGAGAALLVLIGATVALLTDPHLLRKPPPKKK